MAICKKKGLTLSQSTVTVCQIDPMEEPLHTFNQKVVVAVVALTLGAVAFRQRVVEVGVAST